MSIRELPALNASALSGRVQSHVSDTVRAKWRSGIVAADDEGGDSTSLSILDPIGFDAWSGGGVTAKRVASVLRNAKGRDVRVDINSPGGDLFEGIAIYNQLREYEGRIDVRVLGVAASVASVIAMAGDSVAIGSSGFFMIHNGWVVASGDRVALREVADMLLPFDEAMRDVYARRTGLDAKAVGKMMDAETWINGAQAVAQGFADEFLAADATEEKERDDVSALRRVERGLIEAGMTRTEARALVQAFKLECRDKRDAVATGTRDAAGTANETSSADDELSALAQSLTLTAFAMQLKSQTVGT